MHKPTCTHGCGVDVCTLHRHSNESKTLRRSDDSDALKNALAENAEWALNVQRCPQPAHAASTTAGRLRPHTWVGAGQAPSSPSFEENHIPSFTYRNTQWFLCQLVCHTCAHTSCPAMAATSGRTLAAIASTSVSWLRTPPPTLPNPLAPNPSLHPCAP